MENHNENLRHTATPAGGRYELLIEGDTAFVEYTRSGDTLILAHTLVPAQHEGKGVGSRLVRAVLEDLRTKGVRIIPQCPFIAAYIRRHPEWQSLLAE